MRHWLKKLRTENGLTQKEMADKLNIAQNYYNMIENGDRQKDINLSLVTKLAELFDVSVEWIAEQEKER